MGVYVAYQITDEALAAYQRDGFVAIAELIPPEETARLRATLLHLHEKKIGFDKGALFDAVGLDDGSEQRFPQILNPSLLAPELKKSEYFEVAADRQPYTMASGRGLRQSDVRVSPNQYLAGADAGQFDQQLHELRARVAQSAGT